MSERFNNFKKKVQEQFEKMSEGTSILFEVNVDKDLLWNTYQNSFPKGSNDIFRKRPKHECSACRNFIKNLGNVVAIKNNEVLTIWDFDIDCSVYKPVAKALSKFIRNYTVSDIYVSKLKNIGTDTNRELLESGEVITWNHLFVELPSKFVDKSSKSEGDIKGSYRDTKNVFKRSLDEISQEAALTILELIQSNTLYKGSEWKNALTEFIKYKQAYDLLKNESIKNNFAWENLIKAGLVVGRIRNHSIGTLLVNVSEGMDLDLAVRKYETIVAPSNYKRPKAIFTKKMVEEAQKTIENLGYMDSLGRRYATLDDITVNNILFSNKDAAKRIKEANIFDDLIQDAVSSPKKFSKVEEINIEDFIKNVLPTSREIELYLENKHSANMVSLIAPKNIDSKTMFKWDNNFGWAYSGNITDSSMKENVKSAGGNVNGVLRFSIQWNDGIEHNPNDLDAHCIEPNGSEIYFSSKLHEETTGQLDVDIIDPKKGIPAVENITWTDKNAMLEGTYKFFVKNFSNRGGRTGFKAEIEFDGQIYSFDYNKDIKEDENVYVAEVTFNRNTGFSIKELLPSTVSSKDVWGVNTQDFVPVSVIMYSPNYWNEQTGIGHKHYFFMLKDCVNPEMPNGFYNEFLKKDLMKHKRVFEALGSKMRVDFVEDQLSGVGFSSTKRNQVIVKVKGQTERIMKVKF